MKKISVCGGCNAKIAASRLENLLSNIDIYKRQEVVVGFDTKDDAGVLKIGDEYIIETLDFFPPLVEDPYLFGQIAATNALSDIYAMGGEVISCLNIVTFPQNEDFEILKKILEGGASKVKEARGTLFGGHSIHDNTIKYGLSVTGRAKKLWKNDTAREGDVLLLTKKIGTGLICANYPTGTVSDEIFFECVKQMTTLNKYARDILVKYDVHAATDVTGFSLLGHLNEMSGEKLSMIIDFEKVPIFDTCIELAQNFLFTAGAQNNRNYLKGKVDFLFDDFAKEEVLFDPQTSGGLLVSVSEDDANLIIKEFERNNLFIRQIGLVKARRANNVIVR